MARNVLYHSRRATLRVWIAPLAVAAGMVILFGFLARSRSHAFVDALYGLKQIMDESKVIVEGEIETLDQKGLTVTAKVKTVIKGKCPFKQIKMNMGVGQAWFPEVLMKRLQAGAPVLFFWDDGLRCEAYASGHFFQIYGQANPDPNAVWWTLTHIEIKMNRTFNGKVQELIAIVKDVVAGKRAPPPPDPSVLPFTRDELLGLGERIETPLFSQTDEPDGLEAFPQWKTETWGRPGKGFAVFAPPPGATTSELSPGLLGQYYAFPKALEALPDTSERAVDLRRVDKQVNFTGAPFQGTNFAENFCVRWTGLLRIPKDGKYKITVVADKGSDLAVDGRVATGVGGGHGELEHGGEMDLSAGDHAIKIEFWQSNGSACCKLQWEGPGLAKDVVPEKALFHRTVGPRGELLRVEFAPGAQERLAVSRKMDDDFTRAKRLLFEACNQSSQVVRVAWGFTTMPGEQYYESPSMELPPGQWVYDMQVDFTAQTFKSAYTNWLCRSPLLNPGKVVKLTFDVYNAPSAGAILIDRVRPDCGSAFIRSIPLPPAPGKAGGVSWVDCSGTGKLDAFLCNEGGLRLYRNTAGDFVDLATTLFPPELCNRQDGSGLTATWADYDADGKLELLFANGSLLRNERGKFIHAELGVKLPGSAPAEQALWLDANGDGRPDILLSNKQGAALFLNTGQSTARFKDAGATWGLAALTGPLGLSAADFDGDGFIDVLCHQGKGLLLHNEDGKSFRALPNPRLDYNIAQGIGSAWGDFDNDGMFDLFVPQSGKCHLYHNNGDQTFTDVIAHSGDLSKLTGNVRSAIWGDVNMDGNLDLIVGFTEAPARIYLGDGKGRFTLGQSLSFFECARGASGMALADFDGDGDLDLLVMGEKTAGILINQCPRSTGHASLRVRLPINQSLGALVRLYDWADKPLGVRQVGLTVNLGSQEPPEAFFAVKPGNYKVAVLYTSGETKQTNVAVSDKGFLLKMTKP